MTTLETVAQLMEETDSVLEAFASLRDKSTAEEWDKWQDHPLLSPLFDALSDLEHTAN